MEVRVLYLRAASL